MLTKLIGSKTRVEILALFFSEPEKRLYINEITKLIKADPASVHRELTKLVKLGLITAQTESNRRYFSLNSSYTYFEALKMLFENYKKEQEKNKWLSLEDMPNYYPLVVVDAWNVGLANRFFKKAGLNFRFSKLLTLYHDQYCSLFVVKDEFEKLSSEVVTKSVIDPKWAEDILADLTKEKAILIKESHKLEDINFSALSNDELDNLFKKYFTLYEETHMYHWLQTGFDFGDGALSQYLMNYLSSLGLAGGELGEAFSVLTTPLDESDGIREYKEIIGLIAQIQKDPQMVKYFTNTETRLILKNLPHLNPSIDHLIEKHTEDWGYMGYGFTGPGWDKSYFVDLISSLIRQKIDTQEISSKSQNERALLIERQNKLFKQYKMDENHVALFRLAQNLVFTKGARKDAMFFHASKMENLYYEIAKRFYLSLKQVRFLYPLEISKLLKEGTFDTKSLNQRPLYSINYSTGPYSKDVNLDGDKAREFIKTQQIIEENTEDVRLLQGTCASPGRVRGEVKIINLPEDMKKMKAGNILVSVATNPDLVPAIKLAGAIVTDVGGITCHAAIVSRELGIPCTVGTKVATKILKDGDIVDVDATHGKVIKINEK